MRSDTFLHASNLVCYRIFYATPLEELRLILLAVGMAEADIPSIFAGADVNGDGKIDYGEFFTWLCGDINQVL